MIVRKIKSIIKKPKLLLVKPLMFLSPLLGNRLYLKLLFPLKVGYKLNLKNPQTYNEKLQWLKLYYRNPLLPKMVDKYEYKEYIKQKIGDKYVVENYGIWNSFDEIDFDSLPAQFVLKTTHDQGGVVICRDKSTFNFKKAKVKLDKHMKTNLFFKFREWPYKTVEARIIAEKFLIEEDFDDLMDYKFYCFHGKPEILYVSYGRGTADVYLDFYDMNLNYLDIQRPAHRTSGKPLNKPMNFELMVNLAQQIAGVEPHVRIDFYNIRGKIYFGEYTLFQGGGMMPFIPKKWDYILGEMLNLDKVSSENH